MKCIIQVLTLLSVFYFVLAYKYKCLNIYTITGFIYLKNTPKCTFSDN